MRRLWKYLTTDRFTFIETVVIAWVSMALHAWLS